MKKIKVFTTIFFTVLFPVMLFCDDFSQGESLFKANRPEEAIVFFEKTLESVEIPSKLYMYLGVSYFQTGQHKRALSTFLSGIEKTGTNKRDLYYNAANVCFVDGDFQKAEQYYSLAIAADASFSSAFLNRANTQLQLGKYPDAIGDYLKYIGLDPSSEKRPSVEKMIVALRAELQRQKDEALRMAKEEERIKEEQARLAKEQEEKERYEKEEAEKRAAELEVQRKEDERRAKEKAAQEAERRRKLLEEVAAELQQSSSTNLTAGTEGVIEYEDEESELD